MAAKQTIVLLYGGKSGEHEVSLVSAASVLANLNTEKYTVIPVGMDKNGCFYRNDYHELRRHTESLPVKTSLSEKLPSLVANGRLAIEADVIFPVVHGPLYEDGCLQGLLEFSSTAYVGCDVLASAIGMDKDISRRLACSSDIQAARYRVLSWHSDAESRRRFCQQTATALGWPLFVKPCSLGSSVGIHKVNNMKELEHAITDALRYDESILVEEFIQGQEIELAVLENRHCASEPRVSVAGEIKTHHADGFYSYAAKYLQADTLELIIPAKLDDALAQRLHQTAGTIFTRLKCKGMARVDFFVNQQSGAIYFNEINTLPGFTSLSMYPKLWQASGLDYPALLDELIALSIMHHRTREQLVTDYQ